MQQNGSFIGFTFGGRHSSKMGIFRTSKSNRYSTELIPKLREITYENQTSDGQYYWGTEYSKKDINISFAFYGLDEAQLNLLKKTFNDKKIHNLILDEEPYKVWSARLTGSSIINYICFEDDNKRFYCGEGDFTFSAYYPFARSRYQYIEDYSVETIPEWLNEESILTDEFGTGFIYPAILQYDLHDEDGALIIGGDLLANWIKDQDLLIDSDIEIGDDINSCLTFFSNGGTYQNMEEWEYASRIPSREKYGRYYGGRYKIYNAGDLDMPFRLYIPINKISQNIKVARKEGAELLLSNEILQRRKGSMDAYLMIDSYRQIISGCDENFLDTGNIYNDIIIGGNFFELPTGETELFSNIEGKLEFNYLYL